VGPGIGAVGSDPSRAWTVPRSCLSCIKYLQCSTFRGCSRVRKVHDWCSITGPGRLSAFWPFSEWSHLQVEMLQKMAGRRCPACQRWFAVAFSLGGTLFMTKCTKSPNLSLRAAVNEMRQRRCACTSRGWPPLHGTASRSQAPSCLDRRQVCLMYSLTLIRTPFILCDQQFPWGPSAVLTGQACPHIQSASSHKH